MNRFPSHHTALRLCALLTALLALAGCRRELEYDYRPYCEVALEVDWSALSERPEGMSVYFYPADGGKPSLTLTNQVDGARVSVREGVYNVLVFNQSTSEFGSLVFSGMDSFLTAQVEAAGKDFNEVDRTPDAEPTVCEPEEIAVATYERLSITRDMIVSYQQELMAASREARAAATLRLKPQPVVTTADVEVEVNGVQNVRAVRGYVTGMASGCRLATHQTTTATVTHVMDRWDILHSETDYTRGSIATRFTTFGKPGQTAGLPTEPRGASSRADTDHLLRLELLLVDNQTIVSTLYAIGERIEELQEALRLRIAIGADAGTLPPEDSDNPNLPLQLPDVKPTDAPASGFDATVGDWGEEEQIDVGL